MHTLQPREGYSSRVMVCKFAGVGELGKQISSFTSFLNIFLGFTDTILIAKSVKKGKGIQSNINSFFCPCTLLGVNPSSSICPSEEDFPFTWLELWSRDRALLCYVVFFYSDRAAPTLHLSCLASHYWEVMPMAPNAWVNGSVQLFVCCHGCPSV